MDIHYSGKSHYLTADMAAYVSAIHQVCVEKATDRFIILQTEDYATLGLTLGYGIAFSVEGDDHSEAEFVAEYERYTKLMREAWPEHVVFTDHRAV